MRRSTLFGIGGRAAALALAAAMAAAAPALAAPPSTAAEIVAAVEAAEKKESSRIRYAMAVRDSPSSEPRSFVVLALSRDGEDSFLEFAEPRTVRGLRVLSLGDETWIYFPSTGRVRRISGTARSGSVQGVGGDFSYEDLGSSAWSEDYEFVIEAEDAAAWTLLGSAKAGAASGGYDRVRMVVDKKSLRATRIEYSRPKDGFVKILVLSDFRTYGSTTKSSRLEMRDLRKLSITTLSILEAEFGKDLDARWFSPERFYK